MPPAAKKALKVADTVSVKATVFGIDWAKQTYPTEWHLRRLEGTVVGKDGAKWRLEFPDDESGTPFEIKLARGDITFVSRPTEPAPVHVEAADEDSEDEEQPEAPLADSSDDDDDDDNDHFFNEEPDHTVKTGKKADAAIDISNAWVRDDAFCQDQRAKFTMSKDAPKLNIPHSPDMSLFDLGCLFLPMLFLDLMALCMQTRGRAMADKDKRFTAAWTVTRDDLLQWIGVWLYMLAFHQDGSRRAFWEEPAGGYGPRHRLQAWLSLGQNGEKGVTWFEGMEACFTLPQYEMGEHGFKPNDPFTKTRKFWDCLRLAFFAAVTASWLLVLDESMVQWMGRGMPGLMVILRKPTPIGLELHTMCCALSGILVWFEVYEGKEAMEKAKYCDMYGKSIALSLRLTEKFHGSGRVLVADSWFGSVACAIALATKNIFAVMNVKTATKNFPKDELMAEVDEIKGKTPEAREARRARRGKSAAFTQMVQIGGGRNVTLLAAGNNKKIPLLLICTAFTMLPGEEHNKTWKVNNADGSIELRSLKTEQPEVHALYRLWMNVVDIHNKLRQGVVSMADVWGTTSWDKRHFAEGLGFWEVNVYKAFVNFCSTSSKKMPHGEFRKRIAWAFLTLGKEPYPAKANSATPASGAGPSGTNPGGGGLPEAPLPGATHTYVKTPGTSGKTCAYCGEKAYQKCATCETLFGVPYPVCGARSKRGMDCMKKHTDGEPCQHATFDMTSPAKRSMKAEAARRKAKRAGSDTEDGSDGSDSDGDANGLNSPADGTRSRKKAKKEAKAAAEAAAKTAAQEDGRAARRAKRGINTE